MHSPYGAPVRHVRMRRYPRARLNHFEHNLEVWRQLWMVIDNSDVVVIVTDVRNPLYHLPECLYESVTRDAGKPLVVVLGKARAARRTGVCPVCAGCVWWSCQWWGVYVGCEGGGVG